MYGPAFVSEITIGEWFGARQPQVKMSFQNRWFFYNKRCPCILIKWYQCVALMESYNQDSSALNHSIQLTDYLSHCCGCGLVQHQLQSSTPMSEWMFLQYQWVRRIKWRCRPVIWCHRWCMDLHLFAKSWLEGGLERDNLRSKCHFKTGDSSIIKGVPVFVQVVPMCGTVGVIQSRLTSTTSFHSTDWLP